MGDAMMWMVYVQWNYGWEEFYFRESDRVGTGDDLWSDVYAHQYSRHFLIEDDCSHVTCIHGLFLSHDEYQESYPVIDRNILRLLDDYAMLLEMA